MGHKIIRTGNSVAVTLPAKFVKVLSLKAGDLVEIKVNYIRGEVVFRFPSARQLPLDTKKKWK